MRKEDGTIGTCIDFRKLNEVVVRDRYPLPVINDETNKVQNATIFSTIDLRNGFFHVPVQVNSRKYTTFVTSSGQYEFVKKPFEFSNSPDTFQIFVNEIFRFLFRKKRIAIRLDDIKILARNEEALENLKIVLKLAEVYALQIDTGCS